MKLTSQLQQKGLPVPNADANKGVMTIALLLFFQKKNGTKKSYLAILSCVF